MKKLAFSIGILALVTLGILIGLRLRPRESLERPRFTRLDAEQAFDSGDYVAALEMAEQLLEKSPQSISLRMMAAESAAKSNELDRALAHYAKVPDRAPEAVVARLAAGEIYYRLGRPHEALHAMDESLRLDPARVEAHEGKAAMLNVLGRRREALPHLMKLFQLDSATVDHLLQVGNLSKAIFSSAEIERLRRDNPDDLSTNLPLAIQAREQGDFNQAQSLLTVLLAEQPMLLEAHVQQGWLLLNTDSSAMHAWVEALPERATENPDAWYLIGQAALLGGDSRGAIRCSLEAIEREPDHLPSHLAVAQLVRRDGHADRAKAFAARAKLLQRLNLALEQIYTSRRYLPPIEEAAQVAFQLGRVWEAIGWSAYALSIDAKLQWPHAILHQVRPLIRPDSPRTLPEYNLAAAAAWKLEYPLPTRSGRPSPPPQLREGQGGKELLANTLQSHTSKVAFEEVADDVDIHFKLAQPPRSDHGGKRMFESTGGGVGAIDFNGDGWCDLFLVQASTKPPGTEPASAGPSRSTRGDDDLAGDRLMRSLGSGELGSTARFDDVTAWARIDELGYGQGLAIGDVNSDGFDDVYVCNFGRNQLWLNQGDGTFADGNFLFHSDAEPQWTVSAVIADINLDGRAEIYDANYVTGDDVLTKLCDVAGKPRVCPPLVFAPAPHALWMADPQGHFHQFAGVGAELLEGYGLGAVAFKAADGPLPQLFVAIDQQANLLLTFQTDGAEIREPDAEPAAPSKDNADDALVVQDEAIVRAAAFDASGRSQACMGIATGDVNQDGQVDFYVTNFYNESNILYVQDRGFYRDATAEYNLVASSLPMLGFGTQFLDCDLDGRDEIVVLNGHIDDMTHIKTPYKMRPQVLQQASSGKFEQLPGEAVGEFFVRPALARALAKVDFNRDGLEDLVATDLDAPLALLQNRSQPLGKSVTVDLIGTKSDRNAFFTQATLRSADFHQTQQLVSGGGYMASNQRCLRFAVPEDAALLTLELQWPSGMSETCQGMQPSYRYIVVEGRGIVQSFSAESK